MKRYVVLCAVLVGAGCNPPPATDVAVSGHVDRPVEDTTVRVAALDDGPVPLPTTTVPPTTTTHTHPTTTTTTTAPVVPATVAPPVTYTASGIPPILARIRGCESGTGPDSPGNYHITNHHGQSSSSGAYQFVDGTWLAYRGSSTAARAYLASPAEQDAAAVRLYNDQGTTPWNASKGCWS